MMVCQLIFRFNVLLFFRVFLNINPHTGGKRSGKSKRKGKTFDTDVFNLAKAALSAFPDTDFVDA